MLANLRGDELQEALDAADRLYDSGDYDAAIDAYETVLVSVPRLTGPARADSDTRTSHKNDTDSALAAYRAVPAGDSAGVEAQGAIEALLAGVDR